MPALFHSPYFRLLYALVILMAFSFDWHSAKNAARYFVLNSILQRDPTPSFLRSSRQPRRLPSFLVAGVHKAGTTALAAHLLRNHFGTVCGPHARLTPSHEPKGSHFFEDADAYNQLGALETYESYFQHCRKNTILMDASPGSMVHPDRVRSLYEEFDMIVNNDEGAAAADELKIMLVLREPVSREISRYNHLKYIGWDRVVNQTFAEYVSEFVLHGLDDASARPNEGVYVRWLEQWLEVGFRRDQIFIASYDDVMREPHDYLERVHEFLGIPPPRRKAMPKANSKHVKGIIPCRVQEDLAAQYEPWNQKLYAWLEDNPGPPMERSPFTELDFKCKE